MMFYEDHMVTVDDMLMYVFSFEERSAIFYLCI